MSRPIPTRLTGQQWLSAATVQAACKRTRAMHTLRFCAEGTQIDIDATTLNRWLGTFAPDARLMVQLVAGQLVLTHERGQAVLLDGAWMPERRPKLPSRRQRWKLPNYEAVCAEIRRAFAEKQAKAIKEIYVT